MTFQSNQSVAWYATTQTSAWALQPSPTLSGVKGSPFTLSFAVLLEKPAQTIEGIGASFNERHWNALKGLSQGKCNDAMRKLFSDDGLALRHCRTPVGGSDLSMSWYSYDEVADDFALEHFSIDRDRELLIPYIKAALAIQPELKLWASPWSPPTWMKRNGHYAMAPAWPHAPDNGLKPEQAGAEGEDWFIQEEYYFDAYARYFRRYVESYAEEGIAISALMPQNEFNSPQPFPSCCWTAQGLAKFIPHLAREMEKVGTEVLLGSLERANADLLLAVLEDEEAASHIAGIGVQWAGRGALDKLHALRPDLRLWATEHECGRGDNDWRYARYGWKCIKEYFHAGATVWTYWNMALESPGVSYWGWPQNSLIIVDGDNDSYALTPDFHLMRHLSAFVKPNARHIPTFAFMGYENQLAFRNADGSLVIIVQNDMSEDQPLNIRIGRAQLDLILTADSFNTIVVPAEAIAS